MHGMERKRLAAPVDAKTAMTAPSETRSDRRRAAILDAAQACFFAAGYGAASMSSIAKRLGGSKGTLYVYFKTKEELFEAVVQRSSAGLQAAMFDLEPNDDAPDVVLARFGRGLLGHLLRPEAVALQRLVIGEAGRFPGLGEVFYACGPRVVVGRVATYLEHLMAQDRLRRSDPLAAAQYFLDLAVSAANWRRLCGLDEGMTPEDMDQQVAVALELFLRAFARESPEALRLGARRRGATPGCAN